MNSYTATSLIREVVLNLDLLLINVNAWQYILMILLDENIIIASLKNQYEIENFLWPSSASVYVFVNKENL